MNLLVNLLKIVGGLIVGIAAGLLIGLLLSVAFTDASLSEMIGKLSEIEIGEVALVIVSGVIAFIVSVFILVIIHEAGHLVCGLLSGYRFVSFRIFNFTIIRTGGRVRVKRFALAGTGGQCLLTPDRPLADIPVAWYNMGGVLANVLVFVAVLPLLWAGLHPLVHSWVAIFLIVDALMILMNGLPVKFGYIGNDASNMLPHRRSLESKRGAMMQLRSNALIQEGVRPGEMPAEWFVADGPVDYRNALEVSLPIMYASRLIDLKEWEAAYEAFSDLYTHKDEIMPIYVKEIACEMAFAAMVTGRTDEARELLDDDLLKYIRAYSKVMSSKERMLCAISLYIDHDPDKAEEIYRALLDNKEKYLLQGEVKSDLDIMETTLGLAGSKRK